MTVSQDKPLSRRQLRETPRSEKTAEKPGDEQVAEQADGQSADALEATAEAGTSAFHSRDYRPEGRRSSFAPSFTSANLGEWNRSAPVDARPDAAPDGADEPRGASEEAGTDPVADAPSAASHEAAATPAPSADTERDGWTRPARSDLDAPERTMTRRELRILRARAEAAGQPAPDVVFLPNGETTVTGAIDILDSPEPARAGSAGDHELSADRTEPGAVDGGTDLAPEADAAGVVTETRDAVESDASADDEVIEDAVLVDEDRSASEHADAVDEAGTGAAGADSAPQVDAAGVVTEQPLAEDSASGSTVESTPVIPALIEPVTGESPRLPTDADAVPGEIVVDAEQPAPDTDGTPAPGRLRPFDALFLPPSARNGEEPAVDTSSAQPLNDMDGLRGDILAAPNAPAKPFGHWSTQNDDDGPRSDGTLSRDVGVTTGALTTHALVLPSIPDSGEPLLSPLTSTGEVMVTGTIDLPRSFGSTGAHPALFDHPDVDAIIDDSDRDESDAGIAPVRASRAVSSSTTTRSMIGAETAKKSRLLPVLGIVIGGVIVVAAATIVIVMFATNQF